MKPMITSAWNFRKITVPIILHFGLLIFMGCGAPRQSTSDPQSFDDLKALVDKRKFEIKFQWAQPQGGAMIDLMSNPNFIRFNEENVDIFLPYFGVRHSGGAYGSNTGGIKYEGEISNLKINEEQLKNNIKLQFEGRQGSELLIFNITMYDNGKAYANVSSSERANIMYQGGDVKAIPEVNEP